MAKKVSITPTVRPELIEGFGGIAIKNCSNLLHNTGDFIKKYPKFTLEITPEFSHVLLIPENLVIQELIFLQDILCEYNIKNLFVILGKNSCLKIYNKIVESHAKYLDPSINSWRTGDGKCVCEIGFLLKESSSLLFLQEDIGEKKESKNILSFNLQESSKLEFFTCLAREGEASLAETEFNLSMIFLGEYAKASVTGFYLAGKSQKINLLTSQKHMAKNTYSNLIINGVLADCSQVKYCGKIFVAKDAIGVKASQENKNIMLGENFVLDAAPELEVLNSNVECKHGCAAGQFDEKQIFYLQSRGFDKDQATLLLIESFFSFINNLDFCEKTKEILLEQIRLKIKGVL